MPPLGATDYFLSKCVPKVIKYVVDHYVESDKLVREFQVVSLVQTLMIRNVVEYKKKFHQKVYEKIL